MSTRTAVACPEPPRRNEPVTWTGNTTSNTTNAWMRINIKR
ncbi:hypothetical protein [Dactylosporangium sp. CA-139066]